jgi:hypothetical protein
MKHFTGQSTPILVALLAIVAAIVGLNLLPSSTAPPAPRPTRFVGHSTAETVDGVVEAVAPDEVTIAIDDGRTQTYRIGVFTTVCYRPSIGCDEGAIGRLLPGATVTATVAREGNQPPHASTLFISIVADTVRVDAVDGEVITAHSTHPGGPPYTIVRGPFTILVDQSGTEVPGGDPQLQVGGLLYFSGLAGMQDGSPVTIAARLFG